METIEGTPAVRPITHTFYSEGCREQITCEAETAVIALRKLVGDDCPWHLISLTYIQSIDATGRFVYDF